MTTEDFFPKYDEDDEIDGGTRTNVRKDAPKTVVSTEIVHFSCTFSADELAIDEEENGLEGTYCLTCSLEEEGVKGKYSHFTRFSVREECEFVADEDFLVRLDKIVKEEGLASYNGYESYTSGLPDMCGCELTVDYRSGERIYAADNGECFLSPSAMNKLVGLFGGKSEREETGIIPPIFEDKGRMVAMSEQQPVFPRWRCVCGGCNTKDVCHLCGRERPTHPPVYVCESCGLSFYGEKPVFCPECGFMYDTDIE